MFIGRVSVYYEPGTEYWTNSIFALPVSSKEEAFERLKAIANKHTTDRSYSSASVEVGISVAELPEGIIAPAFLLDLESDDTVYTISVSSRARVDPNAVTEGEDLDWREKERRDQEAAGDF